MLPRFIRWFGLWTTVYLLAAATGSTAMAEDTVHADEGNVEAIEDLSRARQQARQRRGRSRRHRR